MYIHYQKAKGIEYAVLGESVREGKKVVRKSINLGRVIDKKRKIFRSRERGYFVYDVTTNTYSNPPQDFIPPESVQRRKVTPPGTLRFGCTFVLNALCEKYGIVDIVRNQLEVTNPDSFLALLYYYILSKDANDYAELWYEGDYIRYSLPNARMDGTEISALLEEAGDEYLKRRFFKAYLDLFAELKDGGTILIDSTGLPNAVHFPLTCLTTKNGKSTMETKLTYVAKPGSELPVFYQYNSGNVPDKMRFNNLLEHMQEYGIDVKDTIVDAGYCSLENITECLDVGIDILLRLSPNLKIYKEAILEVGSKLESDDNCVLVPGRVLYITELERTLEGKKVYLYVGLDMAESFVQLTHLSTPKHGKMPDPKEISRKRKEGGKFVMLSTRHLQKNEVISLYYKRQEIEQLFDVDKNYVKTLPLRVHSEETLRGHLLFTFMGAVVMTLIHQQLLGHDIHSNPPERKGRGRKPGFKAPEFNRIGMFKRLMNQGCIRYEKKLVPDVPNKPINTVYKFFGIESPSHIQIERNGSLKIVCKNSRQN